jgi:hypothetical protein
VSQREKCVCVCACVCVRVRACGLVREDTLLNGNGYFTHHFGDTFSISLPSIRAGMSDEETAIFLANMSAEERTKFQTAMRHAASADASDRSISNFEITSNFVTASRGMQVRVTPACPLSLN